MMRSKLSSKITALLLGGLICSLNSGCGQSERSGSRATNSYPETVELTKQLRRYAFERRQLPANLDALVTAGYLKALPQAPAGKKFAVDTKRAEVIVVSE
jgi:competence protein ComGC